MKLMLVVFVNASTSRAKLRDKEFPSGSRQILLNPLPSAFFHPLLPSPARTCFSAFEAREGLKTQMVIDIADSLCSRLHK